MMSHTLVAILMSFVFVAGAHAAAPDPASQRAVYGGKLQDAQGRPIAGIYPLTFNFYRSEKGGKPTWTEAHYVAVDNGVYAVELGGTKPFPKGTKLENVWLGVSIMGGKEILREKFAGTDMAPAPEVVPVQPNPNPTTTVGVPPAKSTQSYADLAGYAYEAKKAESADSIGGMTADMLKELAKAGAGGGASKPPKIGQAKRYSESAGGTGGQPYTLQCPPGTVVTGIKGGAAAYLDSITLICSPLE